MKETTASSVERLPIRLLLRRRRGHLVARAALHSALRDNDHVYCRGGETAILGGAIGSDHVAYRNIFQGYWVTTLAESCVLVGHKGVGCIVDGAHDGDFDTVDGSDFT